MNKQPIGGTPIYENPHICVLTIVNHCEPLFASVTHHSAVSISISDNAQMV